MRKTKTRNSALAMVQIRRERIKMKKKSNKTAIKSFQQFFILFDFLSGLIAIQVFELQLRTDFIDIVE